MKAARYGFDAPGVTRSMLATGAALLAGGIAVIRFRKLRPAVVGFSMVAGGIVSLGLGGSMVTYGIAGKHRMRDAMLDVVAWTGSERVLDIGTGAGLLLIGAAKRLTSGSAIGVDVWSAKDLSQNSAARTLENAAREGVSEKVAVLTADARSLDFPDESFDSIFSLLCLHNIASDDDRDTALAEIARLLKPGGYAVIGDYIPTTTYARALRYCGLQVDNSKAYFTTALTLMWVVVAHKPYAAREL